MPPPPPPPASKTTTKKTPGGGEVVSSDGIGKTTVSSTLTIKNKAASSNNNVGVEGERVVNEFDYAAALRLLHTDEFGMTCIHLATRNNAPASLIVNLIVAGLNVDTKTPDGITALHLLVLDEKKTANPALVKTLVENGANPNVNIPSTWKKISPYCCEMPDGIAGYSPLMLCVKSNSPRAADFVRYLLTCGADPHYQLPNSNHHTAFELARDAGLTELATLLDPASPTPTLPLALTECAFCRTASTILKACTNCRLVYYCDQNCQRLGWGDHRAVCKQIALVNSEDL